MLLSNSHQVSFLTGEILSAHRPVLLRYALLQLRDSELAEDAVQETLLAALQSTAGFEGKSGLRTWLIGILKHKIADQLRHSSRECLLPMIEQDNEQLEETEEDDFFLKNGQWNSSPNTWASPEASLQKLEFWAIYETCQNNLPAKMARVFMLRELVGLDADEICRDTGLSDANYWVTLHRARLRLRECLEILWFNSKKGDK